MQQVYGRAMCGILDQRTAIVDDRLFFSSGNYSFDDDGLPRHTTSSIYWIRLNETIDVTGPLDLALLGSVDLPSDSLIGGQSPDMPGGNSGTFFYDHTTLYPYAGLVGPDANGINNALWAFNTSSDSWNLTAVEGGQISFGDNCEGVYASDPRTGTSFYTGGWKLAYNGTNNGTVKFRSSNSNIPVWSFETAFGDKLQGPNILKGSMVYVRKGRQGILVAFGGYQTATPGTQIFDSFWDQRPLSDIFIYDIFSSTWYHQTATGDVIPELRTESCAAVSAAPDDSSFQITMHGGWDQLNRRSFNDVYVLSLPSFRWIKVEDSGNPDLAGVDKPGRNRHKCDMWNETSMIVTGGEITLGVWNTTLLAETCNATYPPMKVLDVSTYEWQTQFNPTSTYSVPKVITDVIGGDSSGGATVLEPENGWETLELADIFSQTVVRDTYVPPGRMIQTDSTGPTDPADSPKPSNPSDPNNETESKSQNHGALATGSLVGIVVGAVAGLIVLLAIIFYCSWKRKNRAAGQLVPSSPSTPRDGYMTGIPLVKGWHKVELSSVPEPRYELAGETHVYEVHGDDIAGQKPKGPS
ncbi:hypothetical protein NPX13_g6259 [Xylaria arbuscula]|uniref:Uncharacterized protein n=1 Tax=Xylaria arbuscula TaxID=114810 RepID=A0A9W8NCW2_9PEZI|nr:hypothetical protein NPX13_g6259 [Xylaria arbuscula]